MIYQILNMQNRSHKLFLRILLKQENKASWEYATYVSELD